MPNGGKILVQSRTTPGEGLRQHFTGATAEQYVYISVADTGVGMEATKQQWTILPSARRKTKYKIDRGSMGRFFMPKTTPGSPA
jgi:hypothetical protein